MPRKKFQPPSENKLPEDWFSDIRREDIGYKYTLNLQIMAIARASTMLETPMAVNVFSNAVKTLEALLYPYWKEDDRFLEEQKRVEKITSKTISDLIPNEDDRYHLHGYQLREMEDNEQMKASILRETERLKALMDLMDKKSLLLEHQAFEVIG